MEKPVIWTGPLNKNAEPAAAAQTNLLCLMIEAILPSHCQINNIKIYRDFPFLFFSPHVLRFQHWIVISFDFKVFIHLNWIRFFFSNIESSFILILKFLFTIFGFYFFFDFSAVSVLTTHSRGVCWYFLRWMHNFQALHCRLQKHHREMRSFAYAEYTKTRFTDL